MGGAIVCGKGAPGAGRIPGAPGVGPPAEDDDDEIADAAVGAPAPEPWSSAGSGGKKPGARPCSIRC